MATFPAEKYRAARDRARERAKTQPELVPHGTISGYRYWGCRCAGCRGAVTASGVEYRTFKRARAGAQ